MKVNGKSLDSLRIVKVYLPVAGEDAVEFKFRPLRSSENFDKVCPRPKPVKQVRPGGGETLDYSSPRYKAQVETWARQKTDWEFLISISATDALEWETVDMEKPDTWGNWRPEMEKVFPESHIVRLYQGFVDAQYLTEETMEKARQLFLQRTLEASDQSSTNHSPSDEKTSTPSGEPVNG
jgi:hypothetical protein